MIALPVTFAIYMAVLTFWALPAVGRWFEAYRKHEDMEDVRTQNDRFARDGPLGYVSSVRYLVRFLSALTSQSSDPGEERLRSVAVRRLVANLALFFLGTPALLAFVGFLSHLDG